MKRAFQKLSVFLLIGIVVASTPGCSASDTCTQGDNMTDPRVSGTFDSAAADPEFTITWDTGTERGADLPNDYFAQVELSAETSAEVVPLIESVTYSEPRNITVSFNDIAPYLAEQDTLTFTLEFPDRIRYIDCTHPGMGDNYLLEVTLNFSRGEFTGANFRQVVQLGAI